MKLIKLLLLIPLCLIFINSVSAVLVSGGEWSDGGQSITINNGESVNFNAYFGSTKTSMTVNVKLYDSSYNLINVFEYNKKVYSNVFSKTYTIDESMYENPGDFIVQIFGSDTDGSNSYTLYLTVNPLIPPVNHAPVITSVPTIQINEGISYSYNVDATDADADVLIYSLVTAPSWLSINSATGLISGTAPLVSSDTNFNVEVEVSDGNGGTDTQSYTLTVKNVIIPPVNHAPIITSSPTTNVNEGISYSYNVDATDGDGDILIYSLTENPSWLTINSATGLISGTAPLVSSSTDYNVEVEVSDGNGGTDTQSYTLTVKNVIIPPVNHAPIITSGPVTSIVEGNYYSYQVEADDYEDDDLTYDLIHAPSWLTINPNGGLISGTAPLVSSSTDYNVEVEVSDGNGGTDTQSYTLKVKNYSPGSSGGGGAISTISDDFYYPNKYFDEFSLDKVASYTSNAAKTTGTAKNNGFSVLFLFYILIGLISLGIIILVLVLARNFVR